MAKARRIIIGKKQAPETGLGCHLPDDRAVWVAMDEDTVFLKFKNKNQYVEMNISHEATLAMLSLVGEITNNGKNLRANYVNNPET
jgi:hypothetical protein